MKEKLKEIADKYFTGIQPHTDAHTRLALALGDAYRAGWEAMQEKAAATCKDMAECYDSDIEGCTGEELERYTEGVECSLQLADRIRSLRMEE